MSRTMKVVSCFLLAVPILVVIGEFAIAAKPAPPPPPVPVQYRLTWVDGWDPNVFSSEIRTINDQGTAVGILYMLNDQGYETWRGGGAFRWSEAHGLERLNDLGATWIDLNTNQPVTGWQATVAGEINEAGQIVGFAYKDGEFGRVYLFDDILGFHLLPTAPASPGEYGSASINEAGDVFGACNINGEYSDYCLFFWTPRAPSAVQLLLPGHYVSSYSKISANHFAATITGTNFQELYSYSVRPDGTLDYQFDADMSMFWRLGGMSRNSLVPFLQQVVTRKNTTYSVGIYDANARQITTSLPSVSSLPATNANGDLTLNGTDGVAQLYRHLENRSYKLADLLDAAARGELYEGATTKSLYDYAKFAVLNNSNVASVPTADPYDHIAARYYYYDVTPFGTKTARRAFVLTPVAK